MSSCISELKTCAGLSADDGFRDGEFQLGISGGALGLLHCADVYGRLLQLQIQRLRVRALLPQETL